MQAAELKSEFAVQKQAWEERHGKLSRGGQGARKAAGSQEEEGRKRKRDDGKSGKALASTQRVALPRVRPPVTPSLPTPTLEEVLAFVRGLAASPQASRVRMVAPDQPTAQAYLRWR